MRPIDVRTDLRATLAEVVRDVADAVRAAVETDRATTAGAVTALHLPPPQGETEVLPHYVWVAGEDDRATAEAEASVEDRMVLMWNGGAWEHGIAVDVMVPATAQAHEAQIATALAAATSDPQVWFLEEVCVLLNSKPPTNSDGDAFIAFAADTDLGEEEWAASIRYTTPPDTMRILEAAGLAPGSVR